MASARCVKYREIFTGEGGAVETKGSGEKLQLDYQ